MSKAQCHKCFSHSYFFQLPNLHDAVPPVVGSFDVLDVVDIVIGGNEWGLELVRVGTGTLTTKTVGIVTYERLDFEGGSRALDCKG